MENKTNKTKVRYGVHYNDRNYEYALHSGKKFFLRNLADVINVIEYCVTQDLKKNNYKVTDEMYNADVIRFVNDEKDETFEINKPGTFNISAKYLIQQMIDDTIQRNA